MFSCIVKQLNLPLFINLILGVINLKIICRLSIFISTGVWQVLQKVWPVYYASDCASNYLICYICKHVVNNSELEL